MRPQPVQSPPPLKRWSLFRPLKGFLPYIGIVVGILLIIFQASVISYTQNVLGQFLVNVVNYETQGKYAIGYEKVRYNVFRSQITLTDFTLKQDNKREDDGNLQIDASLVSINIRSIFQFIFQNKLDIVGLQVINPQVEVVQRRDSEASSNRVTAIQQVKNILDEFIIEHLSIEHASITLKRHGDDTMKEFTIRDVSIMMENFLVSSSSSQLFSTDNMEIEILNEQQSLPDDHELSFKRLWVSSRDSSLYLESLQLDPTPTSQSAYSAYLPEVSLHGFDVMGLLQNKLKATTLNIGKGALHGIITALGSGNAAPVTFPDIELDHIILEHSNLILELPLQDTTHIIHVFGVDFDIRHVDTDSSTRMEDFLSTLDVQAHIDSYNFDLVRWQHAFSAMNVSLDLQQGQMHADSFRITPLPGRELDAFRVMLPRLRFKNIDWTEGIRTRNLFSDAIQVYDAQVDIRVGPPPTKKIDIDPQNIFPLLNEMFPSLILNKVLVENSRVTLRDQYNRIIYSGEQNLRLDSIRIDSVWATDTRRYFGVRSVDISMKDPLINPLPDVTIRAGNVDYQSRSGFLDIDDLRLTAKSTYTDQVRLNSLGIRGLQWEALINDQDILIDSLMISKPAVFSRVDTSYTIQQSQQIASTPFTPDTIRVNYINLDEGTARLESLKGNLTLLNGLNSTIHDMSIIKGEQYLNWSSTAAVFESGSFSTGIIDGSHQLSGTSVYFSKADSTIQFTNLRLIPNGKSHPFRLTTLLPSLRLEGIVPAQVLDSSHLHVSRLLVNDPTIDVDIRGKRTPRAPSDTQVLDHIVIDELVVQQAEIEVNPGNNAPRVSAGDLTTRITKVSIHPGVKAPVFELFDEIDLAGKRIDVFNDQLNTRARSFRLNSRTGADLSDIQFQMTTPSQQIHTSINEVSLHGTNWLQSFYAQNYYLDSIVISEPIITREVLGTAAKVDSATSTFGDTLSVNKIYVRNGQLVNQGTSRLELPDFAAEVTGFNFHEQNPNLLYADDVSLNIYNLKDVTNDSLNTVDIEQVALSTRLGSMKLSGISLTPQYDKYTYGKIVGKQTDWIIMYNSGLRIEGMNMRKYVSDGVLELGHLRVDSTRMHVFRDKDIPFPVDQIRFMPRQMISNIGIPLTINSVQVDDLNVTYEEHAAGENTAGSIDFTNLDVSIRNLTNDTLAIARDSIMFVEASANLMDRAPINLQMEYNLNSIENDHVFVGTVGGMDLTSLNKMLEPTVNVQIKSGQLNKLEMSVAGNDHYSIGTMTMLYNDLHIRAINKKRDQPKGMGPAFITFFANTFVINRNNPKFLVPRTGDIYAERDSSRSVFNYLAKTALSGVVSSIGARNNRKQIKQLNKEAKEIKDKKRMRMVRKAEKKEQKQEKKNERRQDAVENREED